MTNAEDFFFCWKILAFWITYILCYNMLIVGLNITDNRKLRENGGNLGKLEKNGDIVGNWGR